MKSLINTLNNLAWSISKLAGAINAKTTSIETKPVVKTQESQRYTIKPKSTITSNPNTDVKVTPYTAYEKDTIRITKKEYDALRAIYNAMTDKGSHPKHHDIIVKDLKTKWYTLHKALEDLVQARSYSYKKEYENRSYKNSKSYDIWNS